MANPIPLDQHRDGYPAGTTLAGAGLAPAENQHLALPLGTILAVRRPRSPRDNVIPSAAIVNTILPKAPYLDCTAPLLIPYGRWQGRYYMPTLSSRIRQALRV